MLLPNAPLRPRGGLPGGHGDEHEPQRCHQGGEEGVPHPGDGPSEEAHHFGGDQRPEVQPHRRAPRPTCPTLRREPCSTPQAVQPPARPPARPPYTHRASMAARARKRMCRAAQKTAGFARGSLALARASASRAGTPGTPAPRRRAPLVGPARRTAWVSGVLPSWIAPGKAPLPGD